MGKKRRWGIAGLAVLALLAVIAAVLVVPSRDLGTQQVMDALREAVKTLPGASVEWSRVSGNPLSGYVVRDVRIAGPEGEVVRASSIRLRLLLPSLLRGNPLLKSITVRDATLAAEKILDILRARSPSSTEPLSLSSFPVILFEPVRIITETGDFLLNLARLSPGEGSVTVSARGTFLGIPLDMGGSVLDDPSFTVTDAFVRIGEASVSLSGKLSPLELDGAMEGVRLEKIATMRELPLEMKGVVRSSLSVAVSGGGPFVSGEGSLAEGDILGLQAEGTFRWTADGEKLTASLDNGTVFSSPIRGSLSLLFSDELLADLWLTVDGVVPREWTPLFPWLSTWEGAPASLKITLKGPPSGLGGEVAFETPSLRIGELPLSELSCVGTVANGKEFSLSASARWNGTPLTASSRIDLSAPSPLRFHLKTDRLDMKSLGTLYAPKVRLGGTGVLDAAFLVDDGKILSAEGTLTAPKIFALGAEGRGFSLTFSVSPEEIRLPSLFVSFPAGGTVTGKGTVTGFATDQGTMALSGEGKGITGKTVEALLGKKAPVAGSYDLTWRAEGALQNPAVSFVIRGKDTPLSPALPLRNLSVSGGFSGGEVALTAGKALLFGGPVEFTGRGSAGSGTFGLEGRFAGLSVEKMAAEYGLGKEGYGGEAAGTFSLSGSAANPKIAAAFEIPEGAARGIPFSKILGAVEGSLTSLKLSRFSGNLFGASLTLEGELSMAAGTAGTLKGTIHNLDVASVRDALLPSLPVSGQVNGRFSVSMAAGKDPAVTLSVDSPILSLRGTLVENAKVTLESFEKGRGHVTLEGSLGKGPITLEGTLLRKEEGVEFSLKNRGKFELDRAVGGFSSQTAGILRGEADISAHGTFGKGAPSVQGALSSNRVTLYGLEITEVEIPFMWRGDKVSIENGRGASHGGQFSMTAAVDPTTMRWEGRLSVQGVDLHRATASFLQGKGQLTGTADLSISGSGTGGMVGLVFGNGEFSARDGALSGFDAIKTLSKDGTVRFASALSYFSVDGRSLYLMPGTRVTAPIGDPIYRYLFANGSIGIGDSPLDLKCSVDINIKALNALLGALQGILSVEGNPLTDPGFFRNFLSGLVGGISNREFRETSFNLKGSWKSPVLTDLLVAKQQKPVSFPRPTRPGREEQKITVTLEFPVGSGENTTTGTEDQLKQQILDNILRQIVPSGSSEDPYDYMN